MDPELVLLDEPLAALDVEVAPAVRRLLADRLTGRAVVLVTHDPLDLWALADDVVVVASGRVAQSGTVEEVLARPASDFAARLAGVSLVEGIVDDDDDLRHPRRRPRLGGPHERGGGMAAGGAGGGDRRPAGRWPSTPTPHPPAPLRPPTSAPAPTSPTQPSAHAPATSPRNSWPARVVSLVPAGALTRVTAELRDGQRVDAEITSRSVAELALAPGSPVILVVKAAQVALYPRR
ncbi:hypothetical protein BFG51_16360 [Dietzia alimentaria]|nr:hypothetical protein BFG51_16360 [Dietzia alimentaria]